MAASQTVHTNLVPSKLKSGEMIAVSRHRNGAAYYPEIPKQMKNLSSVVYYAGNSSRFNVDDLQQIYRNCNVQVSSAADHREETPDKYERRLSRYIIPD